MPRRSDISPLSVLLTRADAITEGSASADTVPSGFPSIDEMLGGGFRAGDLIVLGGDVASGKSALALAIAVRAGKQRKRVGFFTAEMSTDRVLERVLAIEGRVRVDDLRRGSLDDVSRANAGAVTVRLRDNMPIVEPLPSGGTSALSELLDERPEFDLVVVDSIGGLLTARSALEDDLAAVVRELKAVALERNTALLVTSPLPHLNARSDRRPLLDDFGGKGAVKQHADIVFGLFREDMYESSRHIQGATELLVRKNRNGPTGYVDLYFYAQWMRFEDMLDPDQ